MKRQIRRTKKYILLAMLLIAVFVLPGCRTRITNNSEVSNIQYDEGGYLSDTYQARRDELGLSTARSPILPDLGSSSDEDDSEDYSDGESLDYDPEDYEEDFDDPEPETETSTSTSTSTTTTTTPGTRIIRRGTTGTGTPTTTTRYTITFDANGGTIEENGQTTYVMRVSSGQKLGTMPKAKNGSKVTSKWYTSRTGGSQVKSSDKVNGSTTLYAHWDDSQDDTEKTDKLTVTVKLNNGTSDKKETVKKGTTFKLPDPGEREGYTFGGWKAGEKSYKAGKEIKITSDTTIEAQWEKEDSEQSSYTVSFNSGYDGAAGINPITVNKDGTYGSLPTAVRDGYTFAGWVDSNGNPVKTGDHVSITGDQTLTATWTKNQETDPSTNPETNPDTNTDTDAQTHWKKEFDTAVKAAKTDEKRKPVVYSLSDDTEFVQDCYAEVKTEEPAEYDYLIKIVKTKDVSKTVEELQQERDENGKYNGVPIIVMSSDARKSKYQLAYQIRLMNIIHESGIDEFQAAVDLLGEDVDISENVSIEII